MNNYNQNQYGNQNQQHGNNQWGNNSQQRPQQKQYNNNNNNNNNWNQQQRGNWQPQQQQQQQQQYNNQSNNNNQYQPQPQQYNNNNKNNNSWQPQPQQQQQQQQPLQTNAGKGVGNTDDDGWGFSAKPNQAKQNKKAKKQKSQTSGGYSQKLARFGGIWGILAIIVGIAAVLCVVIGMSINEITSRDRTATAATKCGYFSETICGEPIMTSLFKSNFDVECEDVDGKDCCTFKMTDACQLGFICAEGDTCVYCDNLKVGTLLFWICIIALALCGVSTVCICLSFARQFAWIGYGISIIVLIIGLIAYPTMIGNVDRELGCGGNAYCCYFTQCDVNDVNCPTPIGRTYVAMIVSIICCILSIVLLFISKKRV